VTIINVIQHHHYLIKLKVDFVHHLQQQQRKQLKMEQMEIIQKNMIHHKKSPEITGTTRTFRDASGKIRFLCLNPSCNSRLIRRSDLYCKRHQLDIPIKNIDNNVQLITTNDSSINHDKEENNVQDMDVNHNNPVTPSQQISSEPPIKKRKHESQTTVSKPVTLSTIPTNKMVISSTTLLDDQWSNILTLLRQFPQVQLSTNLNVNNSTTHLLVDDNEHHLHCTITKKNCSSSCTSSCIYNLFTLDK